MKRLQWLWWLPVAMVLSSIIWAVFIFNGGLSSLWLTPDQQGYHWYKKEQYLKSSELFDDPAFKASALFRAGEFEKSAALYATMNDANARYNLANANLMMGRYPQAIEFYDQALALKPVFAQAKENRAIAVARQQILEQSRDNDEGTGGMLEADEIVYDNKNNRGQEVTEQAGEQNSSAAHWLDRLQTGPDQFLKHKFSYQYAHQQAGQKKSENTANNKENK